MGERKGTNLYYPPDFNPEKHKSLNGYHGTHALRERAKKIKEGILIIRFEMPFNIWCGGCEKHIGMGVRYNAEKTKVGMYYTTPIFKFRMKCHLCDNYFEIQTDPQNFTYVIVSGARRKEERWKAEDNEQIVTEERETVKKLVNDPMFKLEHDHTDKQKVKKAAPGVSGITELQAGKKDDYLLNKLARSKFRTVKKQMKAAELIDHTLLKKSSLDIKLVKEHDDDVRLAGLMKYKNLQSFEERQNINREQIMNRPIFKNASPHSAVATMITPLSKSLVKRKTESTLATSSITPEPESNSERLEINNDSVDSTTNHAEECAKATERLTSKIKRDTEEIDSSSEVQSLQSNEGSFCSEVIDNVTEKVLECVNVNENCDTHVTESTKPTTSGLSALGEYGDDSDSLDESPGGQSSPD